MKTKEIRWSKTLTSNGGKKERGISPVSADFMRKKKSLHLDNGRSFKLTLNHKNDSNKIW